MDVTMRRLENNLTTLGMSLVVFSLWTLVKTALTFYLLDDEIEQVATGTVKLLVIGIVMAIVGLAVLLQCWVGLSARAQGRGKRKRIVYVVVACIIAFIDALAIVAEIYGMFTMFESDLLSMAVSLVIDVTLEVFMIEMIVSSIQLRRLKKQTNIADGGAV